MPYWIKERNNPQLGVYYVAYGRMKVSEARSLSGPGYGSNTMHRFNSEEEYLYKLKELQAADESVQFDQNHAGG